MCSIVWWNTSLNPYGRTTRSEPPNTISIKQNILALCSVFDIVILGEYIDCHGLQEDLNKLNNATLMSSRPKNMVIVDCHASYGRLVFNNLIILDTLRVSCNNALLKNISHAQSMGRAYRIGQSIRMKIDMFAEPIALFVVHWSQYGETDEATVKGSAAYELATEMEQSPERLRLCVGDFNSEPYSQYVLALKSSRSASFSSKNGGFF